jgi:tRNA threonylcarbamoyladenosine modification (KEOPS) complex Cgi121 subunit
MRQLSFAALNKIKEQDDDLVRTAEELVDSLKENDESQLRIIQSMAESSSSWEVVKLFMRYQAARKQIDMTWTDKAIVQLEALEDNARSMATSRDNSKDLHMELVSRVLGYAVRRHVWNNAITKRKEKSA